MGDIRKWDSSSKMSGFSKVAEYKDNTHTKIAWISLY